MKWTVIWQKAASDQLAEIWVNAHDRQAVADAADRIDRQLGKQADTAGESRDNQSRVVVDSPLVVHFVVDQGDRKAVVVTVHAPLRGLNGSG